MIASAILLSWRRPENLPAIIAQIRQAAWIDEILIWNNGEPLPPLDAEIVQAPRNFALLPRLLLATLARHDPIWFQDDDLLLTTAQLEAVASTARQAPDQIHGVQGRRLSADGRYDATNVFGVCDIVNQAQLVPRAAVSRALARLPSPFWTPGVVDHVEDDILLCLAQGRGRCVSVDCGALERRGAVDAHAWSKRPEHWTRRQQAVDWMLA